MLIRLFNQKLNREKRPLSSRGFTLLEVTICICLLALISSLFLAKINTVIEKNRFDRAVKEIRMKLDFCQKMAFLKQRDTCLQIYSKEDGVECEMGLEEGKGFTKDGPPMIERYQGLYLSSKEGPSSYLSFTFSSTGQVVPSPHFILQNKKGDLKKEIIF